MSASNLPDGTRREDPSDFKLSSGRPLTLQPIDCFQPRMKLQKGSNMMQITLLMMILNSGNREEQRASFAPRSRHLFDKITWGSLPGQESTIWEIYYGIGKMGLVNKAIPNSQYGWKTRYILMQVKTWHKTWSLNWQNF